MELKITQQVRIRSAMRVNYHVAGCTRIVPELAQLCAMIVLACKLEIAC